MKKTKIICLAAAGFLTLAFVLTAFGMQRKISSLKHETLEKDFAKDGDFAQFTLFIPQSAGFTIDRVMYLRYNIEKKLTEEAITPVNEGARLYVDAFCSFGDSTIVPGENFFSSKSTNSKILYMGGDYGLFYPEFSLLPNICADVNHDRILLSKTAAWQLFGGYSLNDFEVRAGNKAHYVSGCFADIENEEYKEFVGEKTLCIADIESNTDMPINVYHILITNPVEGFAKRVLEECIDLEEGSYYMVENSKRFSFVNLLKRFPTLMSPDKQLPAGVVITPNELVSQKAHKALSVTAVFLLVLAFFPVCVLCVLAYKLFKRIKGISDKYIFSKIRDKLSYS